MYFSSQIGPKRSKTPEGFLVCHDVRLSRVGDMHYLAAELGNTLPADHFGIVTVTRDAEEVFRPESIASFNGRPICDGHPPGNKVDPENSRTHVRGTMINPRRGAGIDPEDGADLSQFLLGDMIIHDAALIQSIESKIAIGQKPQVSMGYNASYQSLGAGRARQLNIVGNHGAVVPSGRCGPSCSIGDSDAMSDTLKAALEALSKPAATADAAMIATLDALAKGQKDQGAAIVALGTAVLALAEKITPVVKAPTADEAAAETARIAAEAAEKAKREPVIVVDAAAIAIKAAAVRGLAEILHPGFVMPTADASSISDPKLMADHVCNCQRAALRAAWATDDGKALIKPFVIGDAPDFDKLAAATIDMAFTGAAEIQRRTNNGDFGKAAEKHAKTADAPGTVQDRIEAINEANRKRWGHQAFVATSH